MNARWFFLVAGLIALGADMARFQFAGLALLGVVLLAIAFILWGGFTREFWVADEEFNRQMAEIDADLEAAGR